MKEVIKKTGKKIGGMVFAFFVFCGFAFVDDAAAVGVFYNTADQSRQYVVSNYPDDTTARAAVYAACVDAETDPANCAAMTSANTTALPDNQVMGWVDNLRRAAATRALAREALIANCGADETTCTNVVDAPGIGAEYCGDGTAHPTNPNDCAVVAAGDITGGDCAFVDSAKPIFDSGATMCRARELSDCEGEQTLAGGMCVNPICEGDQTLAGGVCVDPTCVGDQTAVAGICTNPTCEGDQTVEAGICTNPTCPDGQNVVAGVCTDSETPDPGNDGMDGNENENDKDESGDESDSQLGGVADTGGGSSAKKGFVFGAIGLFFAVHFLQGDAENFSYSPAFGYSINESGYSANVGGRMDFQKDEWRLFWTAGQANANGKFGEFRYSSGGEYKTDFWQAAFSESVQGKTADYDLSLSADLTGGIWSLSPVYRLHSRLEEGETETQNSLNLEGVLRYEDWQIRQSAGFQWRRTEEFADNARFRLNLVREF